MPHYDFKTLSPIDFEILVRDLLQKELDMRFESFKTGKDTGIDFRYCPSVDNTLILQCKHYSESPFKTLFDQLKKYEIQKVKKLNPCRYILAISMGLTPLQKDKILNLFHPFIKNTNDIYGREDLNNLLGKFPEIEKHTFKLWLSSISILEEILHGKTKNVSRNALEKMHLHAKYYVQNESFNEALRILNKHHFCIIAGIPGIGKTILAEMLCLDFIRQDYEPIKILSDISEVWSIDTTKFKRLYYYDDFLGQTSTATDKLRKNEDQNLLDFINTVRESKTSKLILTTREYILNQACFIYEKIARANFNVETCVIDLSKYTRLNRAKILFNHIFFSELPSEYKKALLQDKNYLKIIDHTNYNPRIIDLMTQPSRITSISPTDYFKTFKASLENPSEIWKHAFEEQLSESSRNLLLVMVTMPEKPFLEDLQKAFLAFNKQQAKTYDFKTTPKDFMRSLKELEGNFITSEKIKIGRGTIIIRFHNPSIRDFLENYLSSDESLVRDLIKSATFYDQIKILWKFSQMDSMKFPFRDIMKKEPKILLSALKRTLYTNSCRHGFYLFSKTLETKAIFVADITTSFENTSILNFWKKVLDLIEKCIEKNNADPSSLTQLLKVLKEYDLISQ